MGGSTVPKVLAAGGLLAASLMGATMAAAEDAAAPDAAPAAISFQDPDTALTEGRALDLSVREDAVTRFEQTPRADVDVEGPRRLELELAAGGENSPLDVSVAQRASLGGDRNGDVNRSGRGSEVRIGRGLVQERERDNDGHSVYFFAASDNEALTWQPGSSSGELGSRGGGLGYEERVEVGDRSAGVTYERNGVQASLAYVERSESTRVGRQSFSQDEAFTGITVTMRH